MVKKQKQPKCSSTDEWIHMMWYVYDGLSHKKEWNNAICSNMNGSGDYHTKLSKSDKDKHDIIYMWNIKNANKLIYKTEIDSQP